MYIIAQNGELLAIAKTNNNYVNFQGIEGRKRKTSESNMGRSTALVSDSS